MDNHEKYFGEKSEQVTISKFEAFGVCVTSRYGKATEIIELINFSKHVCLSDVSGFIISVFYDSKSSCCSFEIDSSLKETSIIAKRIFEAAIACISQFEWFGTIYHGVPMDANDNGQI